MAWPRTSSATWVKSARSELNTPEFARFHQGDIIGKDGIERQYNDQS